mmetsp:Transcript_19141/g.49006  ORF Transcript_19141/g.49006 Transcript_19141/m.49006 type:complete len:256 (+) Transcript_19141:1287-2054(+)
MPLLFSHLILLYLPFSPLFPSLQILSLRRKSHILDELHLFHYFSLFLLLCCNDFLPLLLSLLHLSHLYHSQALSQLGYRHLLKQVVTTSLGGVKHVGLTIEPTPTRTCNERFCCANLPDQIGLLLQFFLLLLFYLFSHLSLFCRHLTHHLCLFELCLFHCLSGSFSSHYYLLHLSFQLLVLLLFFVFLLFKQLHCLPLHLRRLHFVLQYLLFARLFRLQVSHCHLHPPSLHLFSLSFVIFCLHLALPLVIARSIS